MPATISDAALRFLAGHPAWRADRELLRAHRDAARSVIRNWAYLAPLNWGLQHPMGREGQFSIRSKDDAYRLVERERAHGHYYLSQYTDEERSRVVDRLGAIDYAELLAQVERFTIGEYGKTVDGICLFGGYVFGDERVIPEDIDVTVVLRDSDAFLSPVTIHCQPGTVVDPRFARKPATHQLGLTIVGDLRIDVRTSDNDVLVAAAWNSTVATHVYGNPLTATVAPEVCGIYLPIIWLVWGYKHLFYGDRRYLVTGMNRVVSALYVLNHLARRLGQPTYDVGTRRREICDRILDSAMGADALRQLYFAESMALLPLFERIRAAITSDAIRRLDAL